MKNVKDYFSDGYYAIFSGYESSPEFNKIMKFDSHMVIKYNGERPKRVRIIKIGEPIYDIALLKEKFYKVIINGVHPLGCEFIFQDNDLYDLLDFKGTDNNPLIITSIDEKGGAYGRM